MAKKPARPAKATALRRQAEKLLRTTMRDVVAKPINDQQLVQELLVYQIELEMQSDELRRTQAVLEAAQDRYEDLYDFAPVGYLTLDAQGNIVDANIMAGTLLGFSQNKLSGKSFARFVTPEDLGTFHRYVQDVLEGGSQQFCEVTLRRASGCASSLLLKSLAMRDELGRHTGWRTALLDISERKQAEADLKKANDELTQANERFGWVMRAINDGVWDWDLVREVLYYSPRWKEMHGFAQDDVVEHMDEWVARIHPDDQKTVLSHLEDYLHGRLSEFREEYRIQRKDGTWMWVLDLGVAIFDEQGRAVRIIGAEKDITWRKEAEETLRRQEHEFRALADNVPALFSYIDRKRRYRFVNKRYEELFRRPSGEILGSTILDLLGPQVYAVLQPHLDAAFEGKEVSFEYLLPLRDCRQHWVSARYVPDRDEQGRVIGLFILLGDVTKLKQSEENLREKEQQLRKLSVRLLEVQEEERRRIARELHDDFTQRLASLAIDLRTISRDEACVGSSLDARLQQLGGLSERLAADLQQMAHQLHPSILEHVGLEAAAREQVDEFISRTGLKAEIIVRKMPSAVPCEQALCLYRVLQESLRNVHKHAGATQVLVRLLGTSKGLGLCVHDDGCGFESDGGPSCRKGLGLTSMEERMRVLQGKFRLKAKPGAGTEIHVWVPLEGETGESQ